MIRSYQELCRLRTFEDRFEYLKLGGTVGISTFGYERYLNQILYSSGEWKRFRNSIIVRDNGCDLAVPGREIYSTLTIHHMNALTVEDVEYRRDCVFDPDNVICSTHNTHMAIHYGDASRLIKLPRERRKGDTCPWSRAY